MTSIGNELVSNELVSNELVYPNARFLYRINALGENQQNQLIEEKCTYVGRKK